MDTGLFRLMKGTMITLETNYSKKIGLPGFSSHQFSVTLRTELTDLTQVQNESQRLYGLLQQSVDLSIQQVGFLPEGNGKASNGHKDIWQCSDKQKELILKISAEHKVSIESINGLAQQRFSKEVKNLNKLEASGLIDELIEKHGKQNGNRFQRAGAK